MTGQEQAGEKYAGKRVGFHDVLPCRKALGRVKIFNVTIV